MEPESSAADDRTPNEPPAQLDRINTCKGSLFHAICSRAPEREGKSHLSNFERIWRLQAYLLSEADRTGTPIIINEDKNKATDLVLRSVVDLLAKCESENSDDEKRSK